MDPAKVMILDILAAWLAGAKNKRGKEILMRYRLTNDGETFYKEAMVWLKQEAERERRDNQAT